MKNCLLQNNKLRLPIVFGLMFYLMNTALCVKADTSSEYFVHSMATVNESTAAASRWLEIIDSGDYEKAYEETGSFYKQKISKEMFLARLEERRPLGRVLSREVSLTEFYSNKISNREKLEKYMQISLPDGEYCVVEFRTKFEKNPLGNYIENFLFIRGKDGILQILVNGFGLKSS